MTTTVDTTQVTQALALLHEPGQVFEVRILNAPKSNSYKVTVAGYFDDYAAAAKAIIPYNGKANIYTTLNPCKPALLARAANRLKEIKTDPLAADKDIMARCWLGLDIDPVRPAGISATDAELATALALAGGVRSYLAEWGWPAPLEAHSGNGGHLVYRLDLPNDEASAALVKNVLEHLAGRFNSEAAKVDVTVFNASRIWKVYGTMAVKGDDIPTRPHRLATIEAVPAPLEIVTLEMLKAIAPAPVAIVAPGPVYRNGTGYTETEIESALNELEIGFAKKSKYGRTIYPLGICLTSDAHTDGACITLENGMAGYKCHHDSCSAKTWQDVKPILFPAPPASRETFTITTGPQKSEKPEKPGHDVLRDRWLVTQPPTAYGLGDFRQYHAGLWQPVSELEVKKSVSGIVEAAKVEGIKVTSAIVSSVTELAKFKVIKPDSIWDADSDYLVCRNGTLYIPGRRLGEHNPALYATSGVGYDYDPQAKARAWEAFLFDLAVSTSQTIVDFLQEFAGYALTTDTRHELSIWLYGTPGAGRSTFLTGLEAMLGSRAGLLGLADIVNNRFALANLPGKTLAISTEQPGDYIASTHILNAIISGETIIVDRKFKDAIQVTPRCKLAWAMNDLPRVSDPNSGLFRRVKVIEFPVIPESDRNPALKEAIKNEGAGILNWALDGLTRLRNRGRFDIPQAVKDATESFKANNDIPGRFVEEMCVTGNDENGEPYRVQTSQLYNAYKAWCVENGHKPQSSTSIGEDWKRLRFEKRRPGGVVYWFNVGLRSV